MNAAASMAEIYRRLISDLLLTNDLGREETKMANAGGKDCMTESVKTVKTDMGIPGKRTDNREVMKDTSATRPSTAHVTLPLG